MYCAWCGTQVPVVSYTLCSNCGKPTNGATSIPAGRPAAGGTNVVAIIVAVVVGFFAIVAFLGIVAAIAVPNFLTATQRAKQRRTMADIRTIGTAVEAYATDKNAYPSVSSVEELTPLLVPTYIRTLPAHDGWAGPYRYECVELKDSACSRYVIVSGGKDLAYEHGALRDYLEGTARATTNFDCDVVYSNGEFVEYPEGVQR